MVSDSLFESLNTSREWSCVCLILHDSCHVHSLSGFLYIGIVQLSLEHIIREQVQCMGAHQEVNFLQCYAIRRCFCAAHLLRKDVSS